MTDDVLRRAIAHTFPPGKQQRALAVARTYGEGADEPEAERVRFDLVALARGDLLKLEEHLADAQRDYRDVLLWAEYEVDPVIGERPRARLLSALGLEEGAPGLGRVRPKLA